MNEKNGARAGRGRLIVYCLFGLMFFFSISATMTGILIPDICPFCWVLCAAAS